MTGKGTGDVEAEKLAEVVVNAVRHAKSGNGVRRDNIEVHTQTGAASSATKLVEGVIVDETAVHDNMPTSVEDASIAVIDTELDVRESNIDAEYNVSSVDQLNAALDAEESELQGYAKEVLESGADVAFATEDVADRVASQLAKEGVFVADSISSSTAKDIVEATGAKRVGSLEALDEDALGHADSVDVEKQGDDDVTFITGGATAESVTVIARGSTEHVVDELERALNDALDTVIAALEAGGVVPGAGATEIAIADHIRSEAASIEGRKQLAVEAFADAVDVLPRTLAENTGLDAIDALVDLRAEHESEGIAGVISEGQTGVVDDPVDYGILDPAAVKREAVDSATEAATMIVRIDDVISSS
jgi:chaperonin GroEL (HSP60 family)